jgi:uncharacterized protein YcgI (DUF1989 family)
MLFALMSLFLTVSSCTKEQDTCIGYEVEQFQRTECDGDDCKIIITTIEYCSK